MQRFDVLIIGGGVVGTALSRALLKRNPKHRVALLEKEGGVARHTSGRNSGVLHAGYNQKPGTLKARLCVEGNRMIREYCAARNVPLEPNGILVVAQKQEEIPVLEELLRRGNANGAPGLRILDQKSLKERESNVLGTAALWAPSGAGVDSLALVKALAEEAKSLGAGFFFNSPVSRLERKEGGYEAASGEKRFWAKQIVNCAGLHADRVAHMLGAGMKHAIIPFRGEYYKIRPELAGLMRAMVYAAPDLRYPFLGIHWTKMVGGDLKVGPNAVLAFGRESYRTWDIHLRDCVSMAADPKVWRLLGSAEFRRLVVEQLRTSVSAGAFLGEAIKMVRGAAASDFCKSTAGIRAQLLDDRGGLVDDLVIEKQDGALHVLNAVSPGLTCSMAFAEYLRDQLN